MAEFDPEVLRQAMRAAFPAVRPRPLVPDRVVERITAAWNKAEAQRCYEASDWASRIRASREALRANVAMFECTSRASSTQEYLACDTRPRLSDDCSCGCR